MPAGLDGNHSPVATPDRDLVLAASAELVVGSVRERTLIAIDGRPGAGKSTFADELASKVETLGVQTVRSTTDSFHRRRSERMRLGPTSPDGYYLESHQLDVIAEKLLKPFASGASSVLVATFDEPTDSTVHEIAHVNGSSVLIFDGLFLQRPELVRFWDLVIFLDADARADKLWLDFLLSDLPDDPSNRAAAIDQRLDQARWPRYRSGWTRYVESIRPTEGASLVIDNNDFAKPRIVERGR